MRGTLRLIGAILLTMLLLVMIALVPGYAQNPEGEPLAGPIAEGIPSSPPAELDLERLTKELIQDGVPGSPLRDGALKALPDPSSFQTDALCYDFQEGTGQLCSPYAQGHSYQVGDSFTLSINTTPDANFVLYKWQNGRWSSFPIGSVPGPGSRDFVENVQGPAPANVVLIAVNLLNGDYGWYWYSVRGSRNTCYADIFGTVAWYDFEKTEGTPESNEPLPLANVAADTGQTDVTSAAGGYELYRVPAGRWQVTASKCGFFDWTESVDLECGADTKLDLLVVCQGVLWGYVYDAATNTPLPGVLVTLNVESPSLGRTWERQATTDSSGLWWMLVPLVGEKHEDPGAGPFAYASWSLTMRKDGYNLYEDKYKDDGDGVVDADDDNYYFAEFMGWSDENCIGAGSHGCNEGFCTNAANTALVPCLPQVDDQCYHPDGGLETGCDPVRLVSRASIQGRIYCDGLVQDDNPDAFDPGEEQPNVLVRLYRDTNEDGAADVFMAQKWSDINGYYQFAIDLDINNDGVVTDDDGGGLDEDDFVVVAHPASAPVTDLKPNVRAVRNLNICPPFQP